MLQRFVIPVSLGSKRSRRDTERKLVPLVRGGRRLPILFQVPVVINASSALDF